MSTFFLKSYIIKWKIYIENVLEVKNIQKYYGNKSNPTKAVDNISFNVKKGECSACNIFKLTILKIFFKGLAKIIICNIISKIILLFI